MSFVTRPLKPQPIRSHALQWSAVAIALIGGGLALATAAALVIIAGAALKIPAMVENFTPLLDGLRAAETATFSAALGPVVTPWAVVALNIGALVVALALVKGAFLWASQLDGDAKAVAAAAGARCED